MDDIEPPAEGGDSLAVGGDGGGDVEGLRLRLDVAGAVGEIPEVPKAVLLRPDEGADADAHLFGADGLALRLSEAAFHFRASVVSDDGAPILAEAGCEDVVGGVGGERLCGEGGVPAVGFVPGVETLLGGGGGFVVALEKLRRGFNAALRAPGPGDETFR